MLTNALGAVVEAASFSGHDKTKLMALIQSKDDDDDSGDDAATVAGLAPSSHQVSNMETIMARITEPPKRYMPVSMST